jgi:hypothetical protein
MGVGADRSYSRVTRRTSPEPEGQRPVRAPNRHHPAQLRGCASLCVKSILGGLHHEYDLAPVGL